MKYLIASIGIALIAGVIYITAPAKKTVKNLENPPFAMVQLFTSQGCSSCPDADKLLEEISKTYKDENVFLMSYHVDYWNRLGWEDPFSKKAYTQLQYAYSNKFNSRTAYTPQAVINGKVGFVGSNRSKMEIQLKNYLSKPAKNMVKLSEVSHTDEKVSFNYKVEGKVSGKKLKIALIIDKKNTQIKRGENGGRTLSNINIVVNEKELNLLDSSGAGIIAIPELVDSKDRISLIAYIQDDNLNISAADKSNVQF